MKFETLPLSKNILRSIAAAGYETATPIQEKAIPVILDGRDLIGCAQTGTGKTAAFSLPTLHRLSDPQATPTTNKRSSARAIRCLVLAPTRELALQIDESLGTYGHYTNLRHAVIFGGVTQGSQVRELQRGVDVLVATPGRLLDLMGQGYVDLRQVEILILDEADHMLDMGFIHDLKRIVKQVPKQRQTLLFSATMPAPIRELADQWLHRPVEVSVAPVASTPERVSQVIYFVERKQKPNVLTRFLSEVDRGRTLVFSRTKRGADKIARILTRDGIHAVAIHGNKSQARRQAVIREFNSHNPPVLVATDLAARGLDFSEVTHVINYDMPDTPETYVHRIGRTARAGTSGKAISFCGSDERDALRDIERLTGRMVPVKKVPASRDGESELEGTPAVVSSNATDKSPVDRRVARTRRNADAPAATGDRSDAPKSTRRRRQAPGANVASSANMARDELGRAGEDRSPNARKRTPRNGNASNTSSRAEMRASEVRQDVDKTAAVSGPSVDGETRSKSKRGRRGSRRGNQVVSTVGIQPNNATQANQLELGEANPYASSRRTSAAPAAEFSNEPTAKSGKAGVSRQKRHRDQPAQHAAGTL